MTKSQINRLGDRLRKAESLAEDSAALDEHRESLVNAYECVMRTLRDLGLESSGRIKTAISIVEKLKRESIRLSKLQDIAGCRAIVRDMAEQDHVIETLNARFPDATVIDRRERDSHGYRAVHVLVSAQGKLVEVQVRTELQQLWAAWSEALASALDQTIKYGGGPNEIRDILAAESEIIRHLESQQVILEESISRAFKSLTPNLIAVSRWVGDIRDLKRREDELRDRLTREILKFKPKRQEL